MQKQEKIKSNIRNTPTVRAASSSKKEHTGSRWVWVSPNAPTPHSHVASPRRKWPFQPRPTIGIESFSIQIPRARVQRMLAVRRSLACTAVPTPGFVSYEECRSHAVIGYRWMRIAAEGVRVPRLPV